MGVKLYGLDAIEETLTNVTKKNVSNNVVLIADDFIKTNTLQKGQFNVLFSISVLQYIPFFKLNAFFNKMKEVLKKDGTGYLIFAPKKNKLPNFVNSLLDFGFTNYDPELVLKKLKNRFTIVEHQYIQVDGKNFGYYILFKN